MLRHLMKPIISRETSLNTKDNKMDEASSPHRPSAPPRKTIQVWLCDVCGKQYRNFQEACRHEEICRRKMEDAARSSAKVVEPANQIQSLVSNPVMENCIGILKPKQSGHSEKPHPTPIISVSSVKKDSSKPVVSPKPDQTFATGRPKRLVATHPKFADMQASSVDTLSKKRQRKKPPTSILPLLDSRKKKKDAKISSKKASFASIFTRPEEQKAALAEHRAAEFMAKRRAEALRDRERQQRRMQARQLQQGDSSKPASEAPKSTVQQPPSQPLAVRFPVPSHAGITNIDKSPSFGQGESFVKFKDLAKARVRLSSGVSYRAGVNTTDPNGGDECPRLLPVPGDPLIDAATALDDPLQALLATLLHPPLEGNETSSCDRSLWCDKFGIHSLPDDVCGARNKETAERMLNFVENWKVERRKAHNRRAEKQKALLQTKKRKLKTAYKDELWEDSDDDEYGLCNVCLITGPTASGKTALVHAVAKQSDCLVLEINTSEKRSGTALKHAIEEATQSDSSLDMLKKTSDQEEAMAFDDSDDDRDVGERGSSVVVILIDEVDNIYEDEGDSGFWTALSTVAKRAKCPIFLTANTIPVSLRSIRFRTLETTMPSPVDCSSRMWQVIKSQGFALRKGRDASTAKNCLADIAKLCGCDLRRIVNELQLFARAADKACAAAIANQANPSVDVCLGSDKSLSASPLILSVYPKAVRPNEVSLLTIKGENFLSLASKDFSCEVLVGGQLCPAALVMDECTIFAACPPCVLPANVNDSCCFKGTYRLCDTSRYAPLTIRAKKRTGILSTASETVWNSRLCNNTGLSYRFPWNIEYGFPPPRNDSLRPIGVGGPVKDNAVEPCVLRPDVVAQHAQFLLNGAVNLWCASRPVGLPAPTLPVNESQLETLRGGDCAACATMDKLSSQFSQVSDAALLEDAMKGGTLPFLAGAVPGFGSDLVDDGSADQADAAKKKAKTHSFERLHELGWNDNNYFFGDAEAFMTLPSSVRERRLLAQTEARGRGETEVICGYSATAASFDLQEHEDPIVDPENSGMATQNAVEARLSFEDMLLPGYVPSSLCDLPALLRHSLSTHDQARLALLPVAIRSAQRSRADLMSQIVYQDENRRLLSPGVPRTLSNLESVQNSNCYPHLDFFPLLSVIANLERAAEHAYQQALASDPETAALMQGQRRSTRRTTNLVRPHYFAASGLHDDDSVVHDFGSDFADASLQFRWP